jgi:hypothetical protein
VPQCYLGKARLNSLGIRAKNTSKERSEGREGKIREIGNEDAQEESREAEEERKAEQDAQLLSSEEDSAAGLEKNDTQLNTKIHFTMEAPSTMRNYYDTEGRSRVSSRESLNTRAPLYYQYEQSAHLTDSETYKTEEIIPL